MERCVHGMPRDRCGYCSTRKPKRPNPAHREDKTLFGTTAVSSEEAKVHGYAVVRTQRNHPSFNKLDETIALVHILGHPFLWAIEEIIRRAPNLRTLRVLPTVEGKLGEAHRKLCQGRQIQLVTGYHMPQMAWEEGENRSRHYRTQQAFLLQLQGEQKALFEELLTFGFEAASMASRYFCLQGEEYLPQRRLCADYGYPENMHHNVSDKINAVLYYLDPSFETGRQSKERAESMRARVLRLREIFRSDTEKRKFVEEFRDTYGVILAANFPFVRLETFKNLLEARTGGRLDVLRRHDALDWRVLILRFGLSDEEVVAGVYRTLEQVGEIMGVTRERIRQREERALEFLGITSPSNAHPTKLVENDL